MDKSETYIKMRKRAIFDLPTKQMYGTEPHHYYGDVFVDYRGSFFVRWMDGWIDLPRIDQLQEMVMPPTVLGEIYGHLKLIAKFAEFADNPYIRTDSMEQLWLAFVLKELYSKIWNGEEWVNE